MMSMMMMMTMMLTTDVEHKVLAVIRDEVSGIIVNAVIIATSILVSSSIVCVWSRDQQQRLRNHFRHCI